MSTPHWRTTITLRDGAPVTLRPIAPEDKPLEGLGETRRRFDTGEVELVIVLPAKREIGSRLARALRAVASGTLVPAQTIAASGSILSREASG